MINNMDTIRTILISKGVIFLLHNLYGAPNYFALILQNTYWDTNK